MNRLAPLALLAALLCAGTAALAAGEIYKWTDAKGQVHYSDTPPPGQEHSRVAVRGVRQSIASAAADEAAAEAAAAAASPAKPVAPTQQSNCDIAKRNLDTFAKSTSVVMDSDGDGKPEPLDEATRTAELARNQELVRIYCKEE
jgi:hypothetical protein